MSTVAVLGMGSMGRRMAARIAEAGHEVRLWNRTSATAEEVASSIGGVALPDAASAAVGADVVISMLADDDASRRVWLDPAIGLLAQLAGDTVVIEASTITRSMAVELGEAAVVNGVAFLEAPVVGSRPQADAGALFTLVGGDLAVLDRVRPVIDAYAGGVRSVGAVGNAATMKLAINGLFAAQVAAYAEIVGMLDRSDMSTSDAIEILQAVPITSPGLQRILGLFATRDFAPNFPVELVAKDLRYLTQLAADLEADVPLATAADEVFASGAAGSQASLDIAGIADRYIH